MNNRRPTSARRLFVEAVTDEMRELVKDYDHEKAKALMPFVRLADEMSAQDLERMSKRQRRVRPPRREAAE